MTPTSSHRLIQRALQFLVVLLLASMAVDVLWQIITRFILGDPSVWTEELARFILIWLGALGAALGVAEKFHLEMDFFIQKAKGTTRRRLDLLIHFIVLLVAISVFAYGGSKLVLLAHNLEQTSPALGLPMALVYLVLPLSGVLMTASCLFHMQNTEPLPEEVKITE